MRLVVFSSFILSFLPTLADSISLDAQSIRIAKSENQMECRLIDTNLTKMETTETMMMMKAMYWQQRDKINMRYCLIGRCDSYKWINSVCLHLQTCFGFFTWVVGWNCNYYGAKVVAFFSGEYIFKKNACAGECNDIKTMAKRGNQTMVQEVMEWLWLDQNKIKIIHT